MSLSRIESLKIKVKLLQQHKEKRGKPIKLKEAFEIIATCTDYKSKGALKADIGKYLEPVSKIPK